MNRSRNYGRVTDAPRVCGPGRSSLIGLSREFEKVGHKGHCGASRQRISDDGMWCR